MVLFRLKKMFMLTHSMNTQQIRLLSFSQTSSKQQLWIECFLGVYGTTEIKTDFNQKMNQLFQTRRLCCIVQQLLKLERRKILSMLRERNSSQLIRQPEMRLILSRPTRTVITAFITWRQEHTQLFWMVKFFSTP